MEQKKISFPSDFLWGSATSSHQIEGNNLNNWSKWEKENAKKLAQESYQKWENWQREKFPEMFNFTNYISGKACDHYNLYEKDFDLIKKGGHNAYRFSIEWSRIEPQEGQFNQKAFNHYRVILESLKKRNILPFVTLWHWTNPLWLEKISKKKIGGYENFPFYFSRYAKKVVEELGDLCNFWITLNEPTSIISNSFIRGIWPPGVKNFWQGWKMYEIFAKAHNLAYKEIHAISKKSQVGFANILHSFENCEKSNWLNKTTIKLKKYLANEKFIEATLNNNDFLAVQYYFHNHFKFLRKIILKDKLVSDLNWEIFPYGIYNVLKPLKKYNLPVYITENGLADAEDSRRENFIRNHLFWIHKAITEGVDVRGYFYWSLLDNFEWDKGFWPRFGLIEIDYKTLERKPRKSFYTYKKIIKNNGF